MKRNISNLIKTLFILLILVGLLYLFFKQIDFEKAKYYLLHTKLRYVFSILLIYPFIYYFRSLRWKFLLGDSGEKVKLKSVYSANIIGFAINYLLPARIGEFARAYILGKNEDISVSFIFGTVIIERILDLGAMVVFAGIFYILRPLAFKDLSPTAKSLAFIKEGSFIAFILFIVLILLFLLIFLFKRKAMVFWEKICGFLPRKIAKTLINFGDKFIEGIITLFNNKRKLAIILHSLIIWFLISLSYWIALIDFGLHVNFITIIPYIIALLVGASIPTPGMVGGFEALSQFSLTGLYGMDANIAAAATIILHIGLVLVTLLISIPFILKEGLWVFKIKKIKEKDEMSVL